MQTTASAVFRDITELIVIAFSKYRKDALLSP